MPRSTRLPLAASILLLAAGFAVLPGVWATITVRQAFFDTLGMGAVYHRHYTTERDLFFGTAVALVLLGVPLLLAALRVAGVPDRDGSQVPHARRAVWSVWIVLGAVSALTFGRTMLSKGDDYLAATHAVSFGRTYAGHDVAYYVFQLPLIVSVLRLASFVLVLLAIASGTVYGVAEQRRRGSLVHAGDARRAGNLVVGVTFVYGGLALVCLGLAFYLDRNSALVGGDDLISGADKATRVVEMPSQAVIGAMIMLLGAATCALAFGRLRRHLFLTTYRMAAVAGGVWIGTALLLSVLVTAWWAVLLAIAIAATFVLLRLSRPTTEDRPNLATAHGQLRRGKIDGWPDRAAWAAFVVVTAIVGGAAPAAGASLYDHFTLSGPRYQNQRNYIERSIASTRYGFNLDGVKLTNADTYRRNGVTTAAIAKAPASVASLRFLSVDTVQPACERVESRDQFYNCGDPHIDRYTFSGDRRTMFVMPRLVDWTRVTGFQRVHFAYTSGCGLVMSPVNETDDSGRPVFSVGNIPQQGVSLPKQELYLGDDKAPWAMVDTSQNQFDCLKNRTTTWGGKGIRVGDHRLALSLFLGGLPYIGGGRQFWNSTHGNPAGPDSQVLLYRGIRTRMERLAPFLEWDSKPYYVAADGHAYVIDVGYASTDRLPYSESFGGVRYLRTTVIGVMDAYSGETKLYVVQPNEPITATWMKVYPSLFTPLAQLPAGLRSHVKYGEDAFDVQAAALARYHVTSAQTFYNGDQAWAFTEELVGPGVGGERVVSPSRYTYLVLPGETSERFAVVRSYKPAAQGKGIGFSGWLAVDSEPDRFGQTTVLQFPQTSTTGDPLISLDTFTSNVGRDPVLSQAITQRATQVLRGDTLVVPIGTGLLYVQPLYLDTAGDPFPSLWQVVVGLGDNRVFSGPTFQDALQAALGGGSGGFSGCTASGRLDRAARRDRGDGARGLAGGRRGRRRHRRGPALHGDVERDQTGAGPRRDGRRFGERRPDRHGPDRHGAGHDRAGRHRPGGDDGARELTVRLYAFHCGGERTLRSLFDPMDPACGEVMAVPYFFFLIQHAGQNILFDTGMHPDAIHDKPRHFGADADLYDLTLAPGDDAVSLLAQVGVAPGDVAHIVQSHLHYDHAGGLTLFADATVHVHRDELPFALWPPAYQREPAQFIRREFDGVTRWHEIEGEHDILGDGRLLAFPTPGHTKGHQSLVVQLDSGPVVLVGDAAYDLAKMRQRRLPSVLWSPDAMVASWERLEALERSLGATLLTSHDLDFATSRRLAPATWYE